MVKMNKKYKQQDYYNFMNLQFTENYGWSEEKAASWFMKQNGSLAVRRTWGVTKDSLLSTYIPELKKRLKGGYLMFLMVTVSEGGGAGGWINHFVSDAPGGGLANLIRDCDYITGSIWVNSYPPATTDPYGGYNTPFTEDKPGEMNRYYTKEMKPRTIGEYFIPATMAGNARIWGERWCNANDVYFGNPIEDAMNTLKASGLDWNTGQTSERPGGANEGGDGSNSNNDILDVVGNINNLVKSEIEKLIKLIEDKLKIKQFGMALNTSMPGLGYKNSWLVSKHYGNNAIVVNLGEAMIKFISEAIDNLIKSIQDTIGDLIGGSLLGGGGDNGSNTPPTSGGENGAGTGTKPGGSVMDMFYSWCYENKGKMFDFDGIYPGQCVDMVTTVDRKVNKGKLYKAGWLTGNAIDCWNNAQRIPNAMGDEWKLVKGDISNDANAKRIWNTLPNGAVVFFVDGGVNGHVGVKSGPWCNVLNQNYATDGNGGPITDSNLVRGYIDSGAGFAGAYVHTPK